MSKRQQPTAQQAVVACWRKIGVRGDRSCPELKVHIHCRNCPVYSTAARALLDAPLLPESLKLSTRYFAQSSAPVRQETAAGEVQSVIVFRLRAEWFALPTVLCSEVADLRPIHSLPHRRDGAVLGVANIRGELLVCLSLVRLLGLENQVEPKQTHRSGVPRLLVAKREAGPVVFPVDEVQGVQRVQAQDVQPTPATVARAQTKYAKGLLMAQGRSIGLLDDQLLFYTVERCLA